MKLVLRSVACAISSCDGLTKPCGRVQLGLLSSSGKRTVVLLVKLVLRRVAKDISSAEGLTRGPGLLVGPGTTGGGKGGGNGGGNGGAGGHGLDSEHFLRSNSSKCGGISGSGGL